MWGYRLSSPGVGSGVGGRQVDGDLGYEGGHSPISETHMLRAVPYTLK